MDKVKSYGGRGERKGREEGREGERHIASKKDIKVTRRDGITCQCTKA